MKQRNPIAVILLTFITFGIYSIVWLVKTKNDMNRLGATIPTAWLIIIPFVVLWWMWKYSEGVEKVTGGQTSTVLAFVLQFLLGVIGYAILQHEYNKIGDKAMPAQSVPFGVPVSGFGMQAQTVETSEQGFAAPVQPNEAAQTFGAPVQNVETPVTPEVDNLQNTPPQV